MGEAHLQDESKKIHGDKLAAAFRKRDDEVARLPRHPAAKVKADEESRDEIGSATGHS
ncbi:hypothetical protein [Actinoplanes utahensis]|uniref:hypothetical protein n=1 Tax=Actinoplanes utahensis TaxID=1869 RepID=UPI001377979B|nr:hypothetical protein [Actinoplanes utahensis]GIF30700.1 hypothetical protein Aut01nite_36860 [Actinoplanes utahensis]